MLHEVSPLADKAIAPMLSDRGYRPVEFSSVMYLPLRVAPVSACSGTNSISVRLISPGEEHVWPATAAEGWRELVELTDIMIDLMRTMTEAQDVLSFPAELEGRRIAAGSLAIQKRVALLAGASTIPQWRHRGAQRALLASRLYYAERAGCDLAMMCAEPGALRSATQNARDFAWRTRESNGS